MPFVIESFEDVQDYMKGLVYGPTGVGKTVFVASAADIESMRDVLFLDIEAGMKSLRGKKHIDRITVRSYRTFNNIYAFLREHCKARDEGNTDRLIELESKLRGSPVVNPHNYRTVIIDSLTEVQKLCMYHILGINIQSQRLDMEPRAPEYKEWGQDAEMIRLMVRAFRDLPMNVLFTAGEQIIEDNRKRLHRLPALPGKLAAEVPYFFDLVGYLAIRTEEGGSSNRVMAIQPTSEIMAKCRFTNIKTSVLINPTLRSIIPNI